MAPRAGIEPATFRLTVERSTAELPRNKPVFTHRAYNKAPFALQSVKARLRCSRSDGAAAFVRRARRAEAPQERRLVEATAGIEPACTDLQAEISPFHNPLTLTDFPTGMQITLGNPAKSLDVN